MAITLQRKVLRTIEEKLRQRGSLVDEARWALQMAESKAMYSGVRFDNDGGGSGEKSDKLSRQVLTVIEAREALEEARKWEWVFARMDYQYPTGTEERKIIRYLYALGYKQETVAKRMHYDRQSIRRKRDAWLGTCALLAAEAGLLHLDGGEG